MSKSVKKVIGVVAAIAIPFAAPAIATAMLGGAAAAAAVGTTAFTAASALTGAALGAGTAAATGGDVGRAALFGGLGGGLGGYSGAQAARAAQAAGGAGGAGGAGLTTYSPSAAASQMAATTAAPTTVGGVAVPTVMTGAQMAAAAAPTTAALTPTFTQALAGVPSQIAARFSDPKALADLTLRAGAQIAGSAVSDTGLSPEERGLLAAQTEELRNLQQTNRDAFNLRMQEAMNLIGEARYFDPEYFGLQSARRAQLAVGRERQAGLRGLGGERRRAEARRYDIESGRRTGTAYDVGYGQGVAGRLQTRQAGISAIPTDYSTTAFSSYGPLMNAYGVGYERRRQQQGDIGNLFGSFTGGYKSRQTGDEEEKG